MDFVNRNRVSGGKIINMVRFKILEAMSPRDISVHPLSDIDVCPSLDSLPKYGQRGSNYVT